MTTSSHRLDETQPANRGLHGAARSFSFILGCCLFLAIQPNAKGQSDGTLEYRVKLAFLYNFAQFVQWPSETFSDPAAPLNLCILGPDPFEGEIERSLVGRTANVRHPIQN